MKRNDFLIQLQEEIEKIREKFDYAIVFSRAVHINKEVTHKDYSSGIIPLSNEFSMEELSRISSFVQDHEKDTVWILIHIHFFRNNKMTHKKTGETIHGLFKVLSASISVHDGELDVEFT